MCIVKHLKSLGYFNCYDVWVPYDLIEKKFMNSNSIYDFFPKCNNNDPLFKSMITCNDKKEVSHH